jgi:hypothetical protein
MNTTSIYNNPVVQYGAGIILFISVLGTMLIFAWQTTNGLTPAPWEQTFLVTSFALAANILGYHQGAITTQQTAETTLKVAAATTNGKDQA